MIGWMRPWSSMVSVNEWAPIKASTARGIPVTVKPCMLREMPALVRPVT